MQDHITQNWLSLMASRAHTITLVKAYGYSLHSTDGVPSLNMAWSYRESEIEFAPLPHLSEQHP